LNKASGEIEAGTAEDVEESLPGAEPAPAAQAAPAAR
jgi:hypothetical protein